MLTQQTLQTLQELGFTGMAEAYQAQLHDPDLQALSFDDRFGLLIDREWSARQTRRLARRLQEAKLRLQASVEDIDYTASRGLDRALIRTLAEGRWLHEHQNLLISGPTGVGKTYIACALANAACRQGFTAQYYRLPRLVGDLVIAKADGSYSRLLRKLARTDLLVLDDWGLAALTASEARELLEVIDDRCTTRSTLVASQLPVEDWHATITGPSIADAVLDRLVHNAHKLRLKGESMRKIRAKGEKQGVA